MRGGQIRGRPRRRPETDDGDASAVTDQSRPTVLQVDRRSRRDGWLFHRLPEPALEWYRDSFRRLDEYGLDLAIVGLQSDDRKRALSAFVEEIIDGL